MIGNVVVDDSVLFHIGLRQGGGVRRAGLLRVIHLQLGVTPERKVEAIDEKNPVDGELVHLLRVQRRRFPVEVVAAFVVQSRMDLS